MPNSRQSLFSRRKFIKVTGGAFALASAPLAASAFAEETLPVSYGGPTPNRDFYVTSYGGTPRVDAARWTLKIDGLVERPMTLTYADILRMPAMYAMLTLECIGNPAGGSAIGNAQWTGVKLKPLLERAGVRRTAVYAAMRAADGYATGVPLAEIMRGENWLVYQMNGQPLPPEHGYPLRIFIPGKYGMKQPKWLTELELVSSPFIGYWEARGWSNEAWRKVNSGFFSPRPANGLLDILSLDRSAKVTAPVDLIGWALAGPSGVRGVEISTDRGRSWQAARLLENRSPYIWTVWRYRFAPATPGDYEVRVRATDGTGAAQSEGETDSYAGATAQTRLRLNVTTVKI